MIKLWLLGLLGLMALLVSFKSVLQKIAADNIDNEVVAWSDRFFASVVVVFPLLAVTGIPSIGDDFYLALAISGSINAVATYLITKAYSLTDMSVVAPLFAISPALTTITGIFVLGELPTVLGAMGILLIVFGVYYIKGTDGNHLLSPLYKLRNDSGAVIVLFVVLLYGISSVYDKVGVTNSSPLFWLASVMTVTWVSLTPLMIHNVDSPQTVIKQNYKRLLSFSVAGGSAVVIQMYALELTLVTYVISLKRLSILLALIIGYFVLDDDNITRRRVIGGVLMVLGAVLISVYS